MHTKDIYADTIDEAAEAILDELKEKTDTTRTVSSRNNVFYFDGWDGLGASAVLRAIAQLLATTSADGKRALAELGFDQLIHIDCSMWESRRALQKAVAEQLKLPSEVMELFDRQDEEDDFRGVAQGTRAELQQVTRESRRALHGAVAEQLKLPSEVMAELFDSEVMEMQQHIQKLNRRFLVIFHNGSSEEIDLARCCGFPLFGFSTSKVLWTFQGRFRLKPRTKVHTAMKTTGTTDVFLSAYPSRKMREELWPYLVLQEAAEVAAACKVNTRSHGIINHPEQVTKCFLYMWDLCCSAGQLIDYDLYDLDTHGANYWVCDDIIHRRQQNGLWRAAEALHREIRLDYHQVVPSSQLLGPWQIRSKPYWTSPTYGFILIPARAALNGDMFQHSADKLTVLKLSGCTFDFQSPPFLGCYGLRFLWLDHCQDAPSTDRARTEDDSRRCFQKLWVLDVRYTDCDQILSAKMLSLMTQLTELNVIRAEGWDMGALQGRLPDIRKLRVKKSGVRCSCPENDLFLEMNKMEHLEFSGNYMPGGSSAMTSLFGPGVSSNVCCLESVVVDGCYGLRQISLSGCTELKNLHLGGDMWSLHILDISGTVVKTLDLSTTEILGLEELYLLDCKKLCAILWPPKDNMKEEGLGKLCIDTTQSAPTAQSREVKSKRGTSTATTGTSVAPAAPPHGSQPRSEFDWHISVRDARFLVSIEPVYSDSRMAYVEVSSPGHPTAVVGKSSNEQEVLVNQQQQHVPAIYTNITVDNLHEASEGGGDTPGMTWMWPCPDVPDLGEKSCYLHIQDRMGTKLLSGGEETSTIGVPKFVIDCAKILHVHDSLSMTIFPSCTNYKYLGSEWHMLEWCRIERCPKLDCAFTSRETKETSFSYGLRTFWGSHLLEARYIWKKSETSNYDRTFPYLTFLHLACCPRLIHVLPLSYETFNPNSFTLQFGYSLSQLETLEITWCGDLREVFPLDTRAKEYVEQEPQPVTLYFPSLKHIHLHELPRLERICGVRMSAPNLEAVNIRGCWSLTCLPDVSGSNEIVECHCKKEWWDRLEWDDGSQVGR